MQDRSQMTFRHGRRRFLVGLGSSAIFLCRPEVRSQQTLPVQDNLAEIIQSLKPGEYRWTASVSPSGPILVIVSLPVQRCYVYRNGVLIGISTVSTGRPGHQTPTGVFTVLQKQVHHESNLYDSAPMPFMERLTWTGAAMHAGNLPGYPASHGCVRMPMAFAKLLYQISSLGMTVVITDLDQVPRLAPTPNLLRSENAITTAISGDTLWQPDKSPTGPVSLILSGADWRLLVLRNGILIGSSLVTIDGDITETEAFTLSKIDDQGVHWVQLPLPGQTWDGVREMSASERGRVHVPATFRSLLDGELSPGVTLVVTNDSVQSGATGKSLTVIEAQP